VKFPEKGLSTMAAVWPSTERVKLPSTCCPLYRFSTAISDLIGVSACSVNKSMPFNTMKKKNVFSTMKFYVSGSVNQVIKKLRPKTNQSGIFPNSGMFPNLGTVPNILFLNSEHKLEIQIGISKSMIRNC
jgi:hypothetical protein